MKAAEAAARTVPPLPSNLQQQLEGGSASTRLSSGQEVKLLKENNFKDVARAMMDSRLWLSAVRSRYGLDGGTFTSSGGACSGKGQQSSRDLNSSAKKLEQYKAAVETVSAAMDPEKDQLIIKGLLGKVGPRRRDGV